MPAVVKLKTSSFRLTVALYEDTCAILEALVTSFSKLSLPLHIATKVHNWGLKMRG